MYVRCYANSNWKLWTSEKQQHRFGITGNVTCVPIHAFALHSDTRFFQWSFARILKNISPIVWYCCNIWCPYKISNILYKTNEKAVSFLSTTSGTSRDLSWMPSFSRQHGVSLFGNIEKCVVVSFSGPTYIHESDVEHPLCAFSGVFEIIFKFSANLGVRNESTVKSGIFPRRRFETRFLILRRVQHEEFHYDKAISCKSYVQLLIQDVYSISSKTCQL